MNYIELAPRIASAIEREPHKMLAYDDMCGVTTEALALLSAALY